MMIDTDIQKLKKVFATKDDLKKIKKEIIDGVADYMQEHLFPILNQHERRLDRLEKHVGGFPTIV